MKRQLIRISALAALLAAGCQQEELPGGNGYSSEAIVFTSPYTTTKSPNMRYGSFEKGDKVGVLGYGPAWNGGNNYEESDWNTKKMFATPDVFYNQLLEYADGGLWNYNWTGTGNQGGLQPWADNENMKYAFFAYYPYAEVTPSDNKTNKGEIEGGKGTITLSNQQQTGDPIITYTLPFPAGGKETTDRDWKDVPDLMLSYVIDHTKNNGPVSLNFRHLFCAFEFEVNNYNEAPVTISSLSFNGEYFYRSVSLAGQNQDYEIGTDYYSGQFNIVTANDQVQCDAAKKDANGNVTPTTKKIIVTNTNDPVDVLLIPDANGKITQQGKITVRISINNANAKTQELDSGISFQPGMRSIFSINIVGNDFIVQMRSDGAWEDGGDSDVNFD